MAMRLGARLRAQLPACWGSSSSLLRVGPAWAPSSPALAPAHDARPCRALVASASLLEADAGPVNIYTSFTVYKGKGAVSLKLIKPTWEQTPNGGGIRMDRAGTVLLEFAAASGERQYDWENKGVIGLSAVECGEVLEALEARREASFFHDPNKSGSGEGDVTKTLRISPASQSGYFFNLSVSSRGAGQARYDTVVSDAELRVIRVVMQFVIPRLLGLEEIFAGPPQIRGGGGGGFSGGGFNEPPF